MWRESHFDDRKKQLKCMINHFNNKDDSALSHICSNSLACTMMSCCSANRTNDSLPGNNYTILSANLLVLEINVPSIQVRISLSVNAFS